MSAQYSFDFGCWMRLARSDPQAFERRRKEVLAQAIRQASPSQRRRLEGLQCRIDLERRRARTPMAACLRLSSMMWASVHDELAPALRRLTARTPSAALRGPEHRATVIPFPRR